MKIALEIKNNKKAIRPSTNNIIIYDGKEWYITTKDELFKEYDQRFADKLVECDKKIAEMDARNVEVAEQMLKLENIVSELVKKGE